MIKRRHWHSMPAETVRQSLRQFTWAKSGDLPASSGTAALMLWVALRFMAERAVSETGDGSPLVAHASYDALQEATGLARNTVAQGLKRLIALNLIEPGGSSQERTYRLAWSGASWFKLPCAALLAGKQIRPFYELPVRSKMSLHAMKLYLYLSSIRQGGRQYSLASFETIAKATGIAERDIPRAYAMLCGCGLLARVQREDNAGENPYGPNRYYLKGYQQLNETPTGPEIVNAAAGPSVAAVATNYAAHLTGS